MESPKLKIGSEKKMLKTNKEWASLSDRINIVNRIMEKYEQKCFQDLYCPLLLAS